MLKPDVALRPLLPSDFEFAYGLAVGIDTGELWKYRGTTPSPEQFSRQLYEGVFFQQLAFRPATGERLGVVGIYNMNPVAGFGYVQCLGRVDADARGTMIQSLCLLISIAFMRWPLRRLYFEILEENVARIGSGLHNYLREVSRLVDHEFVRGKLDDLVTFQLDREEWTALERRLSPNADE